MQIVILAVGKLKERYWREALAEYAKRLSGYVNLSLFEVADEPAPDNVSQAEMGNILRAEAERLEKHLKPRDGIVVLDRQGKQFSSEEWSRQFTRLEAEAYGRLVFIIGGSYGLHESLQGQAVLKWSFGSFTLPHQLARIVLAEQIYRGIRIARGEPYHK
ncbi:23S rRNA (pseudouridine(1915)-N(3))-methyltransferase RlmH [Alicyclobacillus curvatus]|nr:23S rRNA (pseudouridine(1915)-N(3))-methyltransferase RlmH [Alicyclobacillus curvatus]